MIFIRNDTQYEIREVIDLVYDDERGGKDSHTLGTFAVIQVIRYDRCSKTRQLLHDDFIGKHTESGTICLIQSSRFSHNIGDKHESGLGYQVFELPQLQLKEYMPFL